MADQRPVIDTPRAFSEGEIAASIAAGSDLSVPLESRPATSPRVQGVVIADAGRPTERSAAKVIDFDKNDRFKPNTSVISRSSQPLAEIPVQRVYLPEKGQKGDTVIEDAGVQAVTTGTRQVLPAAALSARPAPADGTVGGMTPDVEISEAPRRAAILNPGAEHAVGVQPVVRQETRLSSLTPVRPQGAPVMQKQAEVQPAAPAAPSVQLQGLAGGIGIAQMTPAVPQKQRVTISSPTIGKHRIRVDFVGVSSSVVVLAYLNTDDAVIFEPPAGGVENPLTVEFNEKSYTCAYHGFSVEMSYGPYAVFQVVLTRIDE
jgi:hypothetical protein